MRWSLLRGISPVVLAMACAMPATAAVVIDLSGVHPSSTRYPRFRSVVDAAGGRQHRPRVPAGVDRQRRR